MAAPNSALPHRISFMSDLRRGSKRLAPETIDADYIVLPANGPRPREPRHATPPRPVAGMTLLRARGPRSAFLTQRGGPLFWLFGFGLATASFWASGGHALVSDGLAAHQSNAAVRVASVSWRIDRAGPYPVLLVDGAARRDGAGGLPKLDVLVATDNGQATRYRLGTSADIEALATSFVFSGRFRAPTTRVQTVAVTVAD